VAAASGTAQTIYFTSTPPSNPKPGDTYTLTASGGGSGNPVVFSTGGQCDFTSPNLVTFLQGGQCEIAANQNGGNGFSAAPRSRSAAARASARSAAVCPAAQARVHPSKAAAPSHATRLAARSPEPPRRIRIAPKAPAN